MKLSAILLLVGVFKLSAGVGQSSISLKIDKLEISKILGMIEKQSSFRFLYNSRLKDIQQQVSLDVKDQPVEAVLGRIFTGTDLTYKVMENNLIVIVSGKIEKQDIPVTGKVTSDNGEALSGVSVTLKGTTRGTTTDNSGNFSLLVPQNGTLVISYIGYQDQEIAVNNQTVVNVKLEQSSKPLDQVVVVGYGTQRKIDVTGATATVKGTELVKQPVMTPTQAMQGKVAGVQIISSGQPGSQPSVRIRGTGSMLGGVEPLYVVDGVITTDITNINTADIVNVDILKDASSTAIYGARGSNGVIIITTKQGSGKLKLSYNGNVGIQSATNLVKMANAQQYIAYVQSSFGPPVQATGYSTDWYSQILRNAVEQNHGITLSGSSEKTNYLFSVDYIDDQGIVIDNDFKRFTLRTNEQFKITNNLKFGFFASYSNGNIQNVNLGSAYNDAYRAAPTVPGLIKGKYGNSSLFQNVGNPILDIKDNNNHTADNRLQGNAFLEYKPWTWLTLRSNIGADWDNAVNRVYTYQFAADTTTFVTPGGNQSNLYSNLTWNAGNSLHWVWDNTATFNKYFNEHDLTILVGTTSEQIFSSYSQADVDGVPPDPSLWYISNGNFALPFLPPSGGGANQTRNSYLARVNYSYMDKYLFTGNFRADGSSTFPANNRWGYFPSFGVGWVVSREGFMQNQHTFDALKLRASWGKSGNDVTGYGTQGYTLTLLENLPYFFGGQATSGSAISQIVDQNLKWETTTESDIAVEFSTIHGKLTGDIEGYTKIVKDALINVLIPSTLGSYNPSGSGGYVLTNAASIQNKGVEVSLNWHDQINSHLSYFVGANITFNQNTVVGLNGGQPYIDGPIGADQPDVTRTDNGHPIGSFYVQKVVGVFQSQADIDNYKDKNGNILEPGTEPGDFKYQYDANGHLDSVFAGSYQPKEYFGVNMGMNYKNFDLSIVLIGSLGGKIYNGKKAFRQSLLDNVESSTADNYWTNSNHSNSEPRANGGDLPASTYFVESGNYVRINNVNIGYTIPAAAIEKTKVISSLRIYISAQNPLTLKAYSGFTPEIQSSSPTSAGIELNAYPSVKTYSIGVNVGF